jgi:chorismate mutase-like protein
VAGTPSAAAAARFADGAGLVARVFALADARLALMPEVAAAKLAAGVAIADPAREAAVVDAAAREAARLGLQSAPVQTLFAIQLRMARETQQVLRERWRGAAPERSEPASSLVRDLRPKLDALTPALLRAVYLALPVLEKPGFAIEWSALAAIQLPDARWDAAMRAELLTALGAVRRSAGPSLARARAAGVLRIGTPGEYAPFSVETGATLDGADVELAIRLAAGLSLEPVFIRTSWAMLLDDLAAPFRHGGGRYLGDAGATRGRCVRAAARERRQDGDWPVRGRESLLQPRAHRQCRRPCDRQYRRHQRPVRPFAPDPGGAARALRQSHDLRGTARRSRRCHVHRRH